MPFYKNISFQQCQKDGEQHRSLNMKQNFNNDEIYTKYRHNLHHLSNHDHSSKRIPKAVYHGSYATLPMLKDISEAHIYRNNLNLNQRAQPYINVMSNSFYNTNSTHIPKCSEICRNLTHNHSHQKTMSFHTPLCNCKTINSNDYHLDNRNNEEDDSSYSILADKEFHLLHRSIPALRRSGVDTNSIRQYFYPDGGWGWIICGVSFLVHILTTGLQLSYGLLQFYVKKFLNSQNDFEWLGALSWSISLLVSPFIVTLCRKKSTRLLAVVGGLVLPLGILFTSFANELSQIILSYGILFSIGVAMVRESSMIMLGNYFKKRRRFVEMVAVSGEGVGIALYSVVLSEGVGNKSWRLGLQIVAAIASISFFLGLFYRPASLYHPQRRAVQHLKNQRKKLREKSISNISKTNFVHIFGINVSLFKSTNEKIILMASIIAAFGIYTPLFLMSRNDVKDIQDLVLLQTFMGLATTLGVVLSGVLLRRTICIRGFLVTTEVVSQLFVSAIAVTILLLSFVWNYRTLCVLCWFFGVGFGGFRYSIKMLALEQFKMKQFSKAWSLIRGFEAIPVLISVPLTKFLNEYGRLEYGRAGYFICSAAAAIAGIVIFFINQSNIYINEFANRKYYNGSIPTLIHVSPYCYKTNIGKLSNNDSSYIYNSFDCPNYALNRSCMSLNKIENENLARNSCNLYWKTAKCHNDMCDSIEPHRSDYAKNCENILRIFPKSQSFNQSPCSYEEHHQNYHHNQCLCDFRSNLLRQSNDHPLCMCDTPFCYGNSKSQSVPEGLASISQQCICKLNQQPDNFDYISKHSEQQTPTPPLPPSKPNFNDILCQKHYYNKYYTQQATSPITPTKHKLYNQTLSKPLQFVEQITTSV